MKLSEVKVGSTYLAKVSGKLCRVRVNSIIERDSFKRAVKRLLCTNLATGREIEVRSAARLRPLPTKEEIQRVIDFANELPGDKV